MSLIPCPPSPLRRPAYLVTQDFNDTEKAAITFAVCSLKKALNKTLPGNMVTWTTDVGAYFDYATMTAEGCVDLWLDMAYEANVRRRSGASGA